MLISDFATKLDELFDLPAHAEPDGWDFALSTAEKAKLLAFASPMFQTTFNGLLATDTTIEIDRAYLVVFPEASLLDYVIEQESTREGGAVVLTHHPVDMETSERGFIAIPAEQLQRLMALNLGVYVLHAPLDTHIEISTSGAIADGLELARVQTFAPYVGGKTGVIAEQEAEPFDEFVGRVQTLCELPWLRADAIRFAGRDVARVAIVAGGGDSVEQIEEAERLGCDTYLAGHWWTPHPGDWCDQNRAAIRTALAKSEMNFLSASHDGSELVVFRDRLDPLVRSWGLETVLLKQDDHWR